MFSLQLPLDLLLNSQKQHKFRLLHQQKSWQIFSYFSTRKKHEAIWTGHLPLWFINETVIFQCFVNRRNGGCERELSTDVTDYLHYRNGCQPTNVAPKLIYKNLCSIHGVINFSSESGTWLKSHFYWSLMIDILT